MVFRESETVELKSIVVEDIKKEIIAFANCEGGKLYIGVQDDGTVVGKSIQPMLATLPVHMAVLHISRKEPSF